MTLESHEGGKQRVRTLHLPFHDPNLKARIADAKSHITPSFRAFFSTKDLQFCPLILIVIEGHRYSLRVPLDRGRPAHPDKRDPGADAKMTRYLTEYA